MSNSKCHQPVCYRQGAVALITLSLVTFAGCGSTKSDTTSTLSPANAGQTTTSTATTTTTPAPAADTAAPNPHGPPAFSLEGQTEHGDKLTVEGRFGPVLSPAETDASQTALQECPNVDGRELVTRLDLRVVLESGLPGTVIIGGFIPPIEDAYHLVDYLMGYSEGPQCYIMSEESHIAINLGTLQPHEPHHFTMWIVLLDAITPNDPHPSLQSLRHQNWVIGVPEMSVDNALARTEVGGAIDIVR